MESGHSRESRDEKRGRWEGILSEWEGSGLSAAGFCRERGLSYQTFLYWRKKPRRAQSFSSLSSFSPFPSSASSPSPSQSAVRSAAFREVYRIGHPIVESSCLEIVISGIVIRVPPRFEESDLRRVLSLVADVSC